MKTKTKRVLKALLPSRRHSLLALAVLVFGFSLLPSSPIARAQDSQPTASDRNTGDSKPWSQIKNANQARDYFNVPRDDPDHDLFFRNYVGSNWRVPTSYTKDQDFESYQEDVFNQDKKYKIRVYREGYRAVGPGTEDSAPYSYRQLTLTGAYFLDDSGIKEVAEKFQKPEVLAGTVLGGPVGAAAGLGMGLIGGTDEHGVFVFNSDNNPNIQMVLTCNGGGGAPFISSEDKEASSRFVYLPDSDNIRSLQAEMGTDSGTSQFDDSKIKIADVYNVDPLNDEVSDAYGQHVNIMNEPYGQGWSNTAMAYWLCHKAVDRETFDDWCQDHVGQDGIKCFSEAESFFRFNPIAWAIGQIRKIVGAFVGLIGDGLESLTTIGNLAATGGVRESWKVARDMVNLVFILIMVVIAFSTMLRLDTQRYSIRALLPRLVFAIIAVNFSLLVVTILTNVAAVIGSPFIDAVPRALRKNPVANVDSFGGFVGGVAMELVLLIAALVVGLVLLCLLLLFVFRILMIWLLGAMAPFAFLFMVLPLSRSLSSMWLKNLLKWVFMAPISYFILWVGVNFLNESNEFDQILLAILIFIGVVAAAVMIPLMLGGEIMSRALQGTRMASKSGGGLGMMAAGRIPAGDGKNLATRMRAAGYGTGLLKTKNHPPGSRGHFRQQAALEHLSEQTANRQGIGLLTGATEAQRTLAQQDAIARKQKEMALVTPSGKLRIAHAHSDIQPQMLAERGVALDSQGNAKTDSEGYYLNANDKRVDDIDGNKMHSRNIYDNEGHNYGELQHDEREFARSRFASEAAFAELSQAGIAQPKLGEAYGHTGLPQMNEHDPAMASLDRNSTMENPVYRQGSADAKLKYMDSNGLGKLDDQFMEGAVSGAEKVRQNQVQGRDINFGLSGYERTAFHAMQNLDKDRAGHFVLSGHRRSAERLSQRKLMKRFADLGGFQDASINQSVQQNFDEKEFDDSTPGPSNMQQDINRLQGPPR